MPELWRRRLAVFAGGALGTLLRVAVSQALPGGPPAFPWAVWIVNVTGSLLLAHLFVRFLASGTRSPLALPLLCTGLLGSYTTFSTFAVEGVQLVEIGRVGMAAAYVLSSITAGLAAAWIGVRWAQARV